MSLSPQEIIQESIRRYQLDMLFVYYDQLEKKEEFIETFHVHMLILTDAVRKMISTEQAIQWIDKVSHLKLHPLTSKQISSVKQHMEYIFDNDFLDIFDDISLDKLTSFNNVIYHLDIPVKTNNDSLPQSLNSYLEQFRSPDAQILEK